MDKDAVALEYQEEIGPHHIIYQKGEKANNVWYISSGWTGVFSENNTNNPESGRILFNLGPHDFIGLEAINSDFYNQTVLSLNNMVKLVRIPIKSFLGLLASNPEVAGKVILRLLERNSNMSNDLVQATSSLHATKKALCTARSDVARQRQLIANSNIAIFDTERTVESLEDMLSSLILDADPTVGFRAVDVSRKPPDKK